MNRIVSSLALRCGALKADQAGATAVIVAMLTPLMLGMMAFVVDLNRVYIAQRSLQASTDAAALAGAQDIYTLGANQAKATAIAYSSVGANKNASQYVSNAAMVAGYPLVSCKTNITALGAPCVGPTPGGATANVIQVKQTASVRLLFGPVIGIKTITVAASSSAAAKGGASKAMDVAVIVDTTGSMSNNDNKCGLTGSPTKLDCAKAGVRSLLNQLDPNIDSVSLYVFPGVQTATDVTAQIDCSTTTTPKIQAYNKSPIYKLIAFSKNYKTSPTSALNTASAMVQAVGGGAGTCANRGITNPSGQGTFYAGALAAAQADLTSGGTANAQKVIILLSDGDASSSTAPTNANQCQQAVKNARSATGAGFWVFSIAYGATTGGCSTDSTSLAGLTPALSPLKNACIAMQNVATDLTKFYSDTCANSQAVSNLVTVFQRIGQSLNNARVVQDSAVF